MAGAASGADENVCSVSGDEDDLVDVLGRGEPAGVEAEKLQVLAVEAEPEVAGGAGVDDPSAFPLSGPGGQLGLGLSADEDELALAAPHSVLAEGVWMVPDALREMSEMTRTRSRVTETEGVELSGSPTMMAP